MRSTTVAAARLAVAYLVLWAARAAGTAGADPRHAVRDAYYGGFGTGLVRCFANGEYGEGEIRSGDLGVAFYGPSFSGPYSARIHVAGGPSAWDGALSGRTPGMRVSAAA